ncbi:hypothetical protein [Hymenobacter actinosclerus]|uniref:hypothetical protein n=1 Tax=Hymenobacter actinosclerus TaxID=82805 RepID=UPI0011609F0B|nr:hypothetical protein [Hymenobacter actinosclerus]
MVQNQTASLYEFIPAVEGKRERLTEQLKNVLPTVYQCIHFGHDQYSERHANHIVDWTKTTRANIIRDYVVNHIKEQLQGEHEVRFHTKNRMFLVIIGDKIGLRFKKLDKRLKSANIPTRQVRSWRNGTLIIPELNIQELTCIDVGYVNDAVDAGIDKVWAVVRGKDPLVFNLTNDFSGVIMSDLFTETNLPVDSPFTIRADARPKKDNGNQANI